ncbi:DUF6544 family protein [Nonomuraea soli]|uniref:Uncharacterized protein n=1 Tax=Nonomuraea soli TaxID=1032476 RepID=A0A7W0CF55_9ACTN|nr:DUF6544 family protein [Nonomuraea soli]MBA2890046.1 hypothetical protein [Nonomuraea soli]
MSLVIAPAALTDQATGDWAHFQQETPEPEPFDPAAADRLPEPARRWVRHAIRPGAPLRRSVVFHTHGMIKLGSWRSFDAHQALTPFDGYVWAARTGLIRGFDRYRAGEGEMRWRLLGLFPVMSQRGRDVSRSAAGRLAGEFVMAPASALDPRIVWKPVDDRRVVAVVPGGNDVTLTIAGSGRLEAVSLQRWGNPDGGAPRYLTFAAAMLDEVTFDGYTIPAEVRGSWDGDEFIWYVIDEAIFR